MALFGRSLRPDGDVGISTANGEFGAEGGARHTIGDLLRDTRKSYGGDIDRIAATLRIRASYLTAIEENQYGRLPGPVYAQGFVRAYAVHLGLDGEEAIRRFKQEVAGLEISQDLSFPVPLAERSIPGGTMVLAALILALCGYGLWYYVSTSDRSRPQTVSAAPPDLVAATKKPAADVTALGTNSSSSAGTAASATAQPAAAASATTSAAPPVPQVATTAAPSPTMSLPPGVTIAPTVAAPTSAPVQVAPAAAISAPPTLPTATAPAAPATQTVSAPGATAAPPSTDGTATPRVYGAAANVPTRIVIRATKDSWVQIRNGDEVLVQRTLHPGDSVRVPDEAGLSLRTGNGAGIQFEIDGTLFKPLSGTVRTVALDASRLAANNGSPPRPLEFNNLIPPRPVQ